MHSIYAILVANVVLAALLAGLAFVLSKLWRNPQFAHALWLLVLIKLVTPPLIRVPLPHFTFGGAENAVDAEPEASDGLRRFTETITTGESMAHKPASMEAVSESTDFAARPASQTRQPTTSALALWRLYVSPWSGWLIGLSGAGTLVLTWVAFRRHQRFVRVLAAARSADAKLIADAKQLSRRIGLASRPTLRVTDALVCPLVSISGWKPLVVLPSRLTAELSRQQIRSVLAHELAHLRRRDHWIRCFELMVLAVFWWNPIAWWASRKLRQAEEECCDAWVVWVLKIFGPEGRRDYGRALLRTMEILTEGRIVAPMVGAEFGKSPFRRRIEMIVKRKTYHRMPRLGWAAILVLAFAVLPLAAVADPNMRLDEPNSAVAKSLSKQEVIARLEALGGEVRSSGGSVISINLFETKAADADLAAIQKFDKLIGLTLTGTRITDAGLAHLQNMTSLGDLDLTNTSVTDNGLAFLKKLRKLEYLSLIRTKVTDQGLVHVTPLKNLVMLNLSETDITDRGLAHLKGLPQLSTLTLSGTRVTDRGLVHLRGLKSMRDIRLNNTAISDKGLEQLQGMSKLRTVVLNTTKVSGSGLRHLPSSVKSLWLPQTQVDDDGLRRLAHLTQLETLVLSGARVTDKGLHHLMMLKNLRRLSLEGTPVTAAGVKRLRAALPGCRVNR